MRFFRKSPFFGKPDVSAEPANAADDLRADISTLEGQIAEEMKVLEEMKARAATAEARAMNAIRAGNDHAARDALLEAQAVVERAAAVEADLKVMRAILDECYEFVRRAKS